ncbi:MAG: transcription termination factor Rho [SAR324 cluster bacterium]|nr:transcription termination factor Rho [SAR324 cluster bacterium]
MQDRHKKPAGRNSQQRNAQQKNRPQQNNKQHNPAHRHTQNHQNPKRQTQSLEEKQFLGGTAVNPYPRIELEKGSDDLSIRALDLICPIGMGQRALVVSSPGSGKTTFLKNICKAVTTGHPDMKVFCLLVDERPEEVTDFKRGVTANVYSSSMDQGQEDHIKVADQVISEAFKEAAAGHDVMILLDSLTRLARVHNNTHRSGGKTLSGGVGAGALEIPRRIFGAARNVEESGSITIIATILVDTGSAMDTVIFEEFKGTGNMELVLSKNLAQKGIFPAIDVLKSATRRAELLFEPQEYENLGDLYRSLAKLNEVNAMEKLLELLKKHQKNSDLLSSI